MKFIRFIVGAVLIVLLNVVTVLAQQPAASRPATPGSGAGGSVPDGKVAIVDTEAFGDPKTGIVRLVTAFESVNREFLPQRDELQKLRAQYDQLLKDLSATQRVEDEKVRAAKADQAESLKKQIERKSQDAQEAYTKRLRDVTGPVWKDINTALLAYARQRGASVVFDVSKLGQVMLVINSGIDITQGFVADYNQRNPAAVASPTRPAASPTRPAASPTRPTKP
jgi:Skp family chaperone for outer membrane proteins